MKAGTKSLIFGVHQIFWHPISVFIAWCELYGLPNWKEAICIIIHDWGYWGCSEMEGSEGENHPEYAAHITHQLLDSEVWIELPETETRSKGWKVLQKRTEYRDLCLYHSRSMAKKRGVEPSKLCWADKLSIKYDPWWFYLLRAKLSGEIKELRHIAATLETIPESATDREWYEWARARMINRAYTRNPMPPYDENNPDIHKVKS